MKKSWYSIQNKANNSAAISIHDEIGLWGVSAAQFIADVKALGDVREIRLSIHSPGGSVFDGLAMYNVLKAHPAMILGRVEGLAASAASFVLMAADTIEMPEDSFLMIHNAHGGAYGGAEDLRDMADLMEKVQATIANIYQARTGLDSKIIIDMMAEETWMTAKEAARLGFADLVSDAINVAAKADNFSKYFKTAPFASASAGLDSIDSLKEIENYLRDAGLSRTEATAIVAKIGVIKQREAENSAEKQQLEHLRACLSALRIPKSLTA